MGKLNDRGMMGMDMGLERTLSERGRRRAARYTIPATSTPTGAPPPNSNGIKTKNWSSRIDGRLSSYLVSLSIHTPVITYAVHSI